MWNLFRPKRREVLKLRQSLRERERFRRFYPEQFATEQKQVEEVVCRLVQLREIAELTRGTNLDSHELKFGED